MVNRIQVERSLLIFCWVLKFLKVNSEIEIKVFKMIMSLSKIHFDEKKIIITRLGGPRTSFYIKFKNLRGLSYLERFALNYSATPFKKIAHGFIACTFLSYTEIIKKSKYQFEKNYVNDKALEVLAQRPLFLNFSH